MLLAHVFGASVVEGVITALGFVYLQQRHPEYLTRLRRTVVRGDRRRPKGQASRAADCGSWSAWRSSGPSWLLALVGLVDGRRRSGPRCSAPTGRASTGPRSPRCCSCVGVICGHLRPARVAAAARGACAASGTAFVAAADLRAARADRARASPTARVRRRTSRQRSATSPRACRDLSRLLQRAARRTTTCRCRSSAARTRRCGTPRRLRDRRDPRHAARGPGAVGYWIGAAAARSRGDFNRQPGDLRRLPPNSGCGAFLARLGATRGGSPGIFGYTGGQAASGSPAAVSRSCIASSGSSDCGASTSPPTGRPRPAAARHRRDGQRVRAGSHRARPSRTASTPARPVGPAPTRRRRSSCAARSGCSR